MKEEIEKLLMEGKDIEEYVNGKIKEARMQATGDATRFWFGVWLLTVIIFIGCSIINH